MQPEPVSNGVSHVSTEAGQVMESDNDEGVPAEPIGTQLDLAIDIPSNTVGFDNLGRILRGLSFKNAAVVSNGEGSSLLHEDSKEPLRSPVLDRIISSFHCKRSSSVPVIPISNLLPPASTPSKESIGGEKESSSSPAIKVSRSLSVPVGNVVIVRCLSFTNRKEPVQTDIIDDHTSPVVLEDDDQEIPEEEAVCRICLVGLCEGGKTFKMECSCKGDLKLTHEECVVKWFTIKGNRNCDVCGKEVCNLPVAVLRVHASRQRVRRGGPRHGPSPQPMGAWYDLVVLTLISSISYFFILEQLLITDLKSQALIIAAPFSFSLGLLGSMFAIIVAMKEYIWTYAALEFSLVAINLHICYAQLHLRAVYAVLLSAILGFGISISLNSLCLYTCARRPPPRRINSNSV